MSRVGFINIRKYNTAGQILFSGRIEVNRRVGTGRGRTGAWMGDWNNVQGSAFTVVGNGQGQRHWQYNVDEGGSYTISFWERVLLRGSTSEAVVLRLYGFSQGPFPYGQTGRGSLYQSGNPSFAGDIEYLCMHP